MAIEDLRIRLLGPLQATYAGVPVQLGGRRQRAVLAQLLAAHGDVVSSERIIDQLWSGNRPRAAAATLHAYLSNLRKALEPDRLPRTAGTVLLSVPPGYALRIAPEQIDAGQFEQLVASAAHQSEPAERARLLAAALEQWRGTPFAEFADEGWAARERVRLESMHLLARTDHAGALLAIGSYAEAITHAQALVHDAPLNEEGWRLLAWTHYVSGHQGRALETLRQARALLADELGIDPGPALRKLEYDVLHQTVELPTVTARAASGAALGPLAGPDAEPHGTAGARGLPVPATELIGRENEVAELRALVRRPQTRLVTLTGAGGCGKSRLIVECAADAASFDAAWFVALHAASDDFEMWEAIATAVCLGSTGSSREAALAELAGKGSALLILDNCEQISGAGTVVSELLAALPRITVVATSRQPLLLAGEHILTVEPLQLPRSSDRADVASSPSGRMFELYAQRARPSFTINDENAADVAELCRRLDGLPLALELAAAQVRVFAPKALLLRLRSTFGDGFTGADRPERHRTIEATVSWSYDLLDAYEQQVFRTLGVFQSTFDLDAILAVVGGTGEHDGAADAPGNRDDGGDASADAVIRLINANLAHVADGDGGELNIGLLETVRLFAAGLLNADPRATEVRARHLEWCLSTITRAMSDFGTDYASALRRIRSVASDARAALEWAFARIPTVGHDPALEESVVVLAEAVGWYWDEYGGSIETMTLLRQGLSALDALSAGAEARATHLLCRLALRDGDYRTALDFAETGLSRTSEDDVERWARAVAAAAICSANVGLTARSEQLFRRVLDRADGSVPAVLRANAMDLLAKLYIGLGRFGEASVVARAEADLSRQHGLVWSACHARVWLAWAKLGEGDLAAAAHELADIRSELIACHHAESTADLLELGAALASAAGNAELSDLALAAGLGFRRAGSRSPMPFDRLPLRTRPVLEERQRHLSVTHDTTFSPAQGGDAEEYATALIERIAQFLVPSATDGAPDRA